MANEVKSPWALRIPKADKYYKQWEEKFKCEQLEEMYDGFHYQGIEGVASSLKPYSVNLIYSDIKTKIANFIYQNPRFTTSPKPGLANWNPEFASRSSQLKADFLNSYIGNPNLNFVDIFKLGALDSFFRFMVIETGYAANWYNPNKPRPEFKSDTDTSKSGKEDKVVEELPVLESEEIYYRWIPAKRFRVSVSDGPHLKNCDWCGYYEFVDLKVLREMKGVKLPDSIKDTYYSTDIVEELDYFQKDEFEFDAINDVAGSKLVKVWKIWDNIRKKKILVLDGNFEVIWEGSFERLPFATYRPDISLKRWYPNPPVFQLVSPQNEVNESREQMRKYRRRFNRMYEYTKSTISPTELDKAAAGHDGTMIEVKASAGTQALRPVQNAEIGISITEGLIQGKDDFDTIAGNPVARGRGGDRQTATAVKKLTLTETVRKSFEQIEFSKPVIAAARETLLLAGENMKIGMWVKMTSDPGGDFTEFQDSQPMYQYVTAQSINDGYDVDINIDVTNATPEQQAEEETKFLKFMTYLNQFPQIALDGELIRELAFKVDYKNEKVIRKAQRMAQLIMMEKMAAAQQQAGIVSSAMGNGGNANNMGKGMAEQGMPNSPDEISSQLMTQLQ